MIRKIVESDKPIFFQMMKEFYNSNAVLSDIPENHIEQTFNTILEDSPYLDGFFYIHKGKVAGYCLLSFSYSNEAGGMVLLIDELYISPKFRRKGIGSKFLNFIDNEYKEEVVTITLEVVKTNQTAKQLYYNRGFKDSKYLQMGKDTEDL